MPKTSANEGELRKRALVLLGLLAVVAVLLVIVMSTVLGGGSNSGDTSALQSDHITATAPPSGSVGETRSGSTSTPSNSRSPSSSASSSAPPGSASCPTQAPCALSGDVGDATDAINAFRAASGQPAVPVSVTTAATACALARGTGCSGRWAETELSAADGAVAVQKINQFAHFDQPMSAVQIGWAYNPATKTYYFAVISTA